MLYKRSVLKNSKFTDKIKKQSSGGVLSKEKMSLKNSQKIHMSKIHRKNIFPVVSFLIKLQVGNLKLSGAATGDVLQNKAFLKK